MLRNADLARDSLHDAFLEGVRRPPASGENLAGWLFRVALRKARRGPYRSAFSILSAALIASPRDEIAEVLDRMEVLRLLGMLSERQRATVVAQYYLGLDQQEIAQRSRLQSGRSSPWRCGVAAA